MRVFLDERKFGSNRCLTLGDTVVASATFLVDAESNLSTLLEGMGNMPGMGGSVAPATAPVPKGRPAPVVGKPAPKDSMSMKMPE